MPRNNLLVRIAAAVVGIVAIGFAAATVEPPTDPGGSGGVGNGEGEGVTTPNTETPANNPGVVTDAPPFLEYLGLILLVLIAVVVAWYLVANRRELVKTVAVWLFAVAVVIALLWFLAGLGFESTERNETITPEGNEAEPGGELGSGENGQTDTFPISFGPILLLLGVVAAIFGGAFLLSNREDGADGTVAPSEPADDPAAIGAVAGRAADRIDEANDADVYNAVYRAWRDMTRHLDVERPETSTPGEFATAAIEAGIEREHVDELTRLFEEVRYGDADTTEERETRAETVLRRIEAEYADGGGDDPDEGATARGRPGGDDA